MNTKEHNSDVATCRCCLLAETMRGCKACRFNVGLVADTTPQPDPRITRRESILAAFQDEPLTMEEAMELYNELAEIDQALQFHPSDTCQAYVSAAWVNMQEVKF